jgi:hypothetical protein
MVLFVLVAEAPPPRWGGSAMGGDPMYRRYRARDLRALALSTSWQNLVIGCVHAYESAKPKQHPVGMTFQYPGGSNEMLIHSAADWISLNPGTGRNATRTTPPRGTSAR